MSAGGGGGRKVESFGDVWLGSDEKLVINDEYVSSFFSGYMSISFEEKVDRLISLARLQPELRQRIDVDEEWISSWKPRDSDGQFGVTPYQLNRMFLTALLVKVDDWVAGFASRLRDLVRFVRSDNSSINYSLEGGLDLTHYPESLLLVLEYLCCKAFNDGTSDISDSYDFLPVVLLVHKQYATQAIMNKVLKSCRVDQCQPILSWSDAELRALLASKRGVLSVFKMLGDAKYAVILKMPKVCSALRSFIKNPDDINYLYSPGCFTWNEFLFRLIEPMLIQDIQSLEKLKFYFRYIKSVECREQIFRIVEKNICRKISTKSILSDVLKTFYKYFCGNNAPFQMVANFITSTPAWSEASEDASFFLVYFGMLLVCAMRKTS